MGNSDTLPATNVRNIFSANEGPLSLTLESPQKITSHVHATSLMINGFRFQILHIWQVFLKLKITHFNITVFV